MSRDIGRRRCYRAEGIAFGGAWYEDSCRSPILNEQQARDFQARVVAFFRDEMGINREAPDFRVTRAGHAYYTWFGNACYYPLKKLRESTILHEVAHWATPREQHGQNWQRMFAVAIAKFVDGQTAALFLRLCKELPVMKVAAGPKRRWILQEKIGGVWTDSRRPRSLIPNAAKLSMWRGNEEPVYLPGEPRAVWMRMIEELQ